MYSRFDDLVKALKPLVGWEQGRAMADRIDEELTQSESGLFFQDANPMLTLRAMRSIMPEDWIEQYEAYDAATTYSKGKIVAMASKAFKSLKDNNVGHPTTETEWWKEHNLLTDYLESIEEKGIKKVLTRILADKTINKETRSIVESKCLFDGAGRIQARTPNRGKICGFEISPLRGNGVTMKIERIGLQFIGNTGNVTLYLFHSSSAEPIWSKTIEYDSTNGTFKWFDVGDLFLPYVGETNAGGNWYLVYNQADLPPYMESINFGRDWSREPCGTCNKGNLELYNTMSKYVQLSPFVVQAEEGWADNPTMWDIEDMIYTKQDNYGINLQFSIGCDLTDTLIANKGVLANVIQLQTAEVALRTLALNPEVRVNRVQYNADRDNIMYEVDGNGMAIKGLNGELEKAYKAVEIDTSGLDSVCFACNRRGIRFGSI